MAVCFAIVVSQYVSNIHMTLVAIKNFKKGLSEYRHFQGSWSVPRRSGRQVSKLWLKVDSDKLGLMHYSGKLTKDVQNKFEVKLPMGDVLEHKPFFIPGMYQQDLLLEG